MEKKVKIGEKNCNLRTNAALPRLYRILLGRELFEDMARFLKIVNDVYGAQVDETKAAPPIGDQLDMLTLLENITFAMHKNGDPAQPDTVEQWLAGFEDEAALHDSAVIVAVVDLWNHETETTSKEKKKKEPSTAK